MTFHSAQLKLAIVAAMLTAVACANGQQVLTVRGVVETEGPDVLLGELVHNPDTLPSDWAERAVIKAPEAGRPQQLHLASIATGLQRYDDMKDVTLRGELKVTVRRETRLVDLSPAEAAIKTYVETTEPWCDFETRVEVGFIPEPIPLPIGNVEIKVEEAKKRDNQGRYTFSVAVLVDGLTERTLEIPARVVTLQEAWVAARPLSRGHIIGPDDVRPALAPADDPAQPIPATEDIVGMEVNRPLRADQTIGRRILRQPICAVRGEWISVTARRGSVEVTMRAKALSAGRLGDKIVCLNEQSKRQLLAALVGPRQAVLEGF